MSGLIQLARDVDAQCRLHGRFTLRSGQVSGVYFDKYRERPCLEDTGVPDVRSVCDPELGPEHSRRDHASMMSAVSAAEGRTAPET